MQGFDSTPSHNNQTLHSRGIEKEWGTEETYPRASPLTLIGVNKGLKNRGKGKEKEVEEEKEYEGYIEPE